MTLADFFSYFFSHFFRIDIFFSIFSDFWIDFGAHFGSILHHLGIIFASLFQASFWYRFYLIFLRFLDPSNRQNASNSYMKTMIFEKSALRKKIEKS